MDILNKELKEKHKMLGENNVEFIKNINDIENIIIKCVGTHRINI